MIRRTQIHALDGEEIKVTGSSRNPTGWCFKRGSEEPTTPLRMGDVEVVGSGLIISKLTLQNAGMVRKWNNVIVLDTSSFSTLKFRDLCYYGLLILVRFLPELNSLIAMNHCIQCTYPQEPTYMRSVMEIWKYLT